MYVKIELTNKYLYTIKNLLMNFKKNYEFPHKIIFNQTNNILKHNYTDYIKINNNGVYRIKLNLNKYGKKNILGCKNLIIILDLVSDDIINNSTI